MRQQSLRVLFGVCDDTPLPEDGTLEVYDLFCGAGGFSCGATTAGCKVAFACDHSPEAIETHARNHRSTRHLVCDLPCELPLPTDGRLYHLHGSPPCQLFSSVNKNSGLHSDKTPGINLIEWYLQFALSSGATSWSMEQVAAVEVLEILERVRLQNLGAMAYAVFDFSKLGVPQNRKRVLAGSPHLIAKLQREEQWANRRSVCSVIAKPRGTHIRGGNTSRRETQRIVTDKHGKKRYQYARAKWTDYCFPIDGVAPTVTSRAPWWIKGDGIGCNRSVLYVSELAALQTFPPTYKWPDNKSEAYRQIGNAVPPRVAELLLRTRAPLRALDLAEGLRCGSPSLRA